MAGPSPDNTAYQSLYRRFRPQRFDEVLGQEHVSLALRNAVRDARVGHAYLFSGPRGTGKTSTARILAKALDCAAPEDGEPCGACNSCVDIARGTSMDVHELDAASNNGVDAMRELVARSALGTPGTWKVYIIDEVHMLSTAASNALLKTLEEPPSHVVFVLATTDAQKVLPTIRSRTQHFEFRLIGSETLKRLLDRVRSEAGLEVGDEAIDSAVRRGRGSARDALSSLDQVAAGGAIRDDIAALADMADSLADQDARGILVEVAKASSAGHDPSRLAGELADYLRQGFLSVLSPDLVAMTGAERQRAEQTAARMGLPALVRSMEALGRAIVDMRESPDPRVHLETTLVRLAHPEMDDSTEALLERVERLERTLAAGGTGPSQAEGHGLGGEPASQGSSPSQVRGRGDAGGAAVPSSSNADARRGGQLSESDPGTSGPELARRALSEIRNTGPKSSSTGSATVGTSSPVVTLPPPEEISSPDAAPSIPSRDELVQVWGDGLLASLPGRARVRFRVGRFLANEVGTAVFALPNDTHRDYCEAVRADVETALRERFGTAVPLKLVVDDDAPGEPFARLADPRPRPSTAPEDADDPSEEELLDPAVLEAQTDPAGAGPTPEERIKLAFPGAQEV